MLPRRRNSPPTIILDTRLLAGVAAAALLLAVVSFLLGRWSVGEPTRGADGLPETEAEAGQPPPIEVRQRSIEDDLSFLNRVERDRREGGSSSTPTVESEGAQPGRGTLRGADADTGQAAPARAASAQTASPERTASAQRPAPAGARPSSPPLPADDSGYLIQVFASEHRSRAEEKRGELAAKGYPVAVVTTRMNNKTYYRVRVGPYSQKSRAITVKERLEREEGLSTWIIRP